MPRGLDPLVDLTTARDSESSVCDHSSASEAESETDVTASEEGLLEELELEDFLEEEEDDDGSLRAPRIIFDQKVFGEGKGRGAASADAND